MLNEYRTKDIKEDIREDLYGFKRFPRDVKDIKVVVEMKNGQNFIRSIGGL